MREPEAAFDSTYLESGSVVEAAVVVLFSSRELSACLREMVAWLKARFPGVPILALSLPTTPPLSRADYNVNQNNPERWLPLITRA
jgi:hypothetical protein